MERERFIMINRNMIKNVNFSSIEEFRCFFMMEVEKSVFGSNELLYKPKIFEEEFKIFVFRSKKAVNMTKFIQYREDISKKCYCFDKSNGFIKLYKHTLEKFKTLNQLYAYISIHWGDTVSYIEQDVFYNWFDVKSQMRAQTFKRAVVAIGYSEAKYEIKYGKIVVYKSYNDLSKEHVMNDLANIESERYHSVKEPCVIGSDFIFDDEVEFFN